jgi:8-oxo-dGTP pyrophosphatase MutT (NUDIX family)
MQAYLAIKYKEDKSNKKLIQDITQALKKINISTYSMTRDFKKGRVQKIYPDVFMAHTFRAIDESDFVIVEFSEKSIGLGIEAGYAFSKGKPIVVIAQEETEISFTMKGIAKRILFYTNTKQLTEEFRKLSIEIRGVGFVILRPDKKVLMQLRDNNSKRYKNMWCFPGGACEGEETYHDTVVREVKEEYELEIKKEECELLTTRTMGFTHVFICHIDDTQHPVLNEGADMKWMNIEEIRKIVLGYNQQDILHKLEQYLKPN